ncbi:MAG: HEPN domain-containing protein [Candidatus Omnitrophica bacterium]|nr:HEPN domain-containing protein [Candidatus Omnitrophota bacterium]
MIEKYLKEWLIKAQHDLQAAENELNVSRGKVLTDIICFHAQQTIEKYLKAYLVSINIEFGKTHSLEYLRELCKKEGLDFKGIEMGDLSYFAVEVRYPDDFYMPTQDEAEKSVKTAQDIKHLVLNKLGIDEKEIPE